MSKVPTFIRSLSIQAFRAYLDPRSFDFSKQRSLAVFAPNGFGKSSLIDALEFAFSDEGTLRRLGVRAVQNKAGVAALEHDLAKDRKLSPSVAITFRQGSDDSLGTRLASGAKRERPEAMTLVRELCAVDPIIRGFELRNFVEHETAQERYESVANWLQLGPLAETQKNLRALRQQTKAAAEDSDPFDRIDAQLKKQTGESLTSWATAGVIGYANAEILHPLDTKLDCKVLDPKDAAFIAVADRAAIEEKQLGVEGLRQIKSALSAIHEETVDPLTSEVAVTGMLTAFLDAVGTKVETSERLAAERAAAADAVFANIWKHAEPLFAKSETAPTDCPVCMTPIISSKAGSREALHQHLVVHMEALKDYAEAKTADEDADKAVTRAHTRLSAGLKSLSLPDDYAAARVVVDAFRGAVDNWKFGDSLSADTTIAALTETLEDVNSRIATIIQQQGEHTYIKAKVKLERLAELADEHALATRTQIELKALSEELTRQSGFVSTQIRAKVQTLLDSLQSPINNLYSSIQGEGAATIRLELPPEDDTTQQRLHLLIDFSESRKGVQPGGYLSDSQIHSLALALRLSAIKAFNGAAPFVALDDIVTSYDADHRRTIAALLASEFTAFQVIITTHDERFYLCLKDQQSAADWRFSRIKKLDRGYGPRFADEKITDAMVEDRWAAGESAANEMRKAEEEWLLRVCREFGVSIRIRPLERAYQYDRGELASALAAYLNDVKLVPPKVPGVNNRFLASLQQGVVENFGSHFQEGPYGDGSTGDEKARWAEFVSFRSYFVCGQCKRPKFKRPHELKKPVCAHSACETQFAFATPTSSEQVA